MSASFAAALTDVTLLLLAAHVAGWAFQRADQPSVVGEVLAGVLLGPAIVVALGAPGLGPVLGALVDGPLVVETRISAFLAQLGAVFLLFLVGLEISPEELLDVGLEAAVVATIGIIIPFLAGYGAAAGLGWALRARLILGLTFVVTSVGVTARVLQDLDVLGRSFSRVILGAALVDDVLSLVAIAVVSGIASTGTLRLPHVARLVAVSLAFLVAALAAVPVMRRTDEGALPFRNPLHLALVVGIGFSAAAAHAGLSPIVGSFFAGMAIAEIDDVTAIEEAVGGLGAFLTPIFFAVVGLRLDLEPLLTVGAFVLGTALTALAVATKFASGLGAWARGRRTATVVGVAMIPRGEVGLIVASIGLGTGAVTAPQYALVLFVVLGTTLLGPLLLSPVIRWADGAASSAGPGGP